MKTEAEVAALRDGRAFIDLSRWRKVLVRGGDASGWLNDLLSAELSGLTPGTARRSLLLSPTGRIRADVTVARLRTGHLLVQDPRQSAAIDTLLEPYVLSSDVRLDDRTSDLALLAFPGADALPIDGSEAPPIEGWESYRPSTFGEGADVVLAAASHDAGRRAAQDAQLVEATPDAVEAWRIERGAARFGVDLAEDSLPHEAGLDSAIAYDKGCFLGQEAVAKVRNLGRPRFVVLAARADGLVHSGDPVLSDGSEAGTVTSAVRVDGGSAAIVRVRSEARAGPLRTGAGEVLRVLGLASG